MRRINCLDLGMKKVVVELLVVQVVKNWYSCPVSFEDERLIYFFQDHLPKSCKGKPNFSFSFVILSSHSLTEVEEDEKHLDEQHAIEEDM